MKHRLCLLPVSAALAAALPVSAQHVPADPFGADNNDALGAIPSPAFQPLYSLDDAGAGLLAVPASWAQPRLVQIDLSGAASFDALHIPGNFRHSFELADDERISRIEIVVTGLSNDPAVGTDGGSWPSEARLALHDGGPVIVLDVPLYSSPAYDHNGTPDPPDLPTVFTGSSLAHPAFAGPGTLTLQLYETLDDAPQIADGIYLPGSYVIITIVPEPAAALLLLAAGAALGHQRRRFGV